MSSHVPVDATDTRRDACGEQPSANASYILAQHCDLLFKINLSEIKIKGRNER